MLHACLHTICFVFCYTLWCFYAFSRTNLLTRCHSASSLFSAVFVFQKSYTGNILGIGRNKSQSSYFPKAWRSPKQRWRGGGDHATPWCGPPLDRARAWCGPLVHLLMPPFCLYIPLDGKTLKTRSIFHETYCKSPSSSTRDREGSEALPGTCQRWESPSEAFFITMPASGVMYE
jgi:hypothetical protein